MKHITKAAETKIKNLIFKAIDAHNKEYRQNNQFSYQKNLYSDFINQTPNHGYGLSGVDLTCSGAEEEFLHSWDTSLINLKVVSAELFTQDAEEFWYVTYHLALPKFICIVSCKLWLNGKSQFFFYFDEAE